MDLAVDRADLTRITETVRSLGLEYRHIAGVDMFVDAKTSKTQSGVHLVFVQERFFAEPAVSDAGILFVSPAELVRMKLISFRQRDKTHIIDMDSVGLITPEIEAGLSEPLRDRLQRIRAEEAQSAGAE